MYDETNVPGPEYRVRTVARYVVTRYCHPFEDRAQNAQFPGSGNNHGSSKVVGEFDNEQQAYDVAQALSKVDPRSTVTT